jgi:UDP-N-acetylglucosamine pyrophosphorylase
MVNAIAQLQLLDVVALKEDLPDHHLLAGQVGTIVELLAPDVYEVELSDDDGQSIVEWKIKSILSASKQMADRISF